MAVEEDGGLVSSGAGSKVEIDQEEERESTKTESFQAATKGGE